MSPRGAPCCSLSANSLCPKRGGGVVCVGQAKQSTQGWQGRGQEKKKVGEGGEGDRMSHTTCFVRAFTFHFQPMRVFYVQNEHSAFNLFTVKGRGVKTYTCMDPQLHHVDILQKNSFASCFNELTFCSAHTAIKAPINIPTYDHSTN